MRKNALVTALVGLAVSSVPSMAFGGTTLQVGAGKTYTNVCDAIDATNDGDTVEIDAGTYAGEACTIAKNGVTVRGVGGRAVLDATGFTIPNGKAIFPVDGVDVTLENLEFVGAAAPDANGAGIRFESTGALTVRGCYFHENENGILGGQAGASLVVEYSEFARNGHGTGCQSGGCSHNMYIGPIDEFTLRYSYSHRITDDDTHTGRGHLVKSRARKNFILYNRITGEDGPESYELNFPVGGLVVMVGNVVEKSPNPGNPGVMVFWADESLGDGYDDRVFAANNTFSDMHAGATAFQLGKSGTGATLTAHNNLFTNTGKMSSGGDLSPDNLMVDASAFVDASNLDFHLGAQSPALDKGVDPGSADSFSLTPTAEYVDALKEVARKSDGKLDLGAFEYGTDVSGAGQDGGGGSASMGGAGTAAGGSSSSNGGTKGVDGATSGGGATSGAGASSSAGGPSAGGSSAGGSSVGGSSAAAADAGDDSSGCAMRAPGRASEAWACALAALGLAVAARGRVRRTRG